MARRVLLTGGSGFLGVKLREALAARGHDVVTPGRPSFDLMDRASVQRVFDRERPDTVVHSAAHYGGLGICLAEPADILHRNSIMSLNVIDVAARAGVKRFLSVGSACAYPGLVGGDMSEDSFWDGPLHPSVEAYGFTKKLQLLGLRAYQRQFGMVPQTAILTNLYGEHDAFGEYRSHVAAAMVRRFAEAKLAGAASVTCWGTGSPVREFLYVGDAAEGIARLLETDEERPVNIGTGIGTSIRELAEVSAKTAGFQGEIKWDASRPDGAARKVLDVRRMREVLRWAPPTTLAVGLETTMRWYLANKESADARP